IKGKTYSRIEFVYPAKIGWNNKVEDWAYPMNYGNCVFLENDLCKVNSVKPFECLKVMGCKDSLHSYRDEALLIWNKEKDKLPIEITEFIESK
ncbi:MAG: hypothetical protein IIB81_03250, partial [Nanoarchaeota archaeon]|nr:hypothetical protein [Nanoarchaeota archaeon]